MTPIELPAIDPVRVVLSAVWLAMIALLICEFLVRAGNLVMPYKNGSSPFEVAGRALLTGLILLGSTLMGLGCAGLLFDPLVLLAVLAPAVAGFWLIPGRSLVFDALAGMFDRRGILGRWALLPFLVLVPLAFLLAIPDVCSDAAVYHLGAPWQFRIAHRLLSTDVPFPFLLPLPIEIAGLVPLAIGDFRLATWINLAVLLAGFGVFMGRHRISSPAILAIGLTLAVSVIFGHLPGGKCDPAVAGIFIAGIVLTSSGSWRTGALMLGAASAAKYTTAPLVVAWLLLFRPPKHRRMEVMALLLIPALPWMMRAWLSTGNPIFPFGVNLFPSPFWGEANEGTFIEYSMNLWDNKILQGMKHPVVWFSWMASTALPVAILIPGMLVAGGSRRPALAMLVGALAITQLTHLSRYTLPALVYFCLIAPQAAIPAGPLAKNLALILIGCWAVLQAPFGQIFFRARWNEVSRPVNRQASSLDEASGILRRIGATRAISAGEWTNWPIPLRLISSGNMGETPFIWKAVRDSRDYAGIARRFRQSGARAVIQNTVAGEWHGQPYAGTFGWDREMLSRYLGFALRWLEPAGQSARCDFEAGGYQVYRLRSSPLAKPLSYIPGLPGTESAVVPFRQLRARGRLGESAEGFRGFTVAMPEVLSFRIEYAFDLCTLSRWEESWRMYQPATRSGVIYSQMALRGVASLKTGHLEEAGRELREDIDRYPFNARLLLLEYADTCIAVAKRDMAGRHYDRAALNIEKAISTLTPPMTANAEMEKWRIGSLIDAQGLAGMLGRRIKKGK